MGSEYSDDVTGGDGVSEDDYYHGVKVGVDLYLDRAMNAEATATRRLELLERAKGQLILTPGQRKSPLVREIEKELADAVGSQD